MITAEQIEDIIERVNLLQSRLCEIVSKLDLMVDVLDERHMLSAKDRVKLREAVQSLHVGV